MLRNLHMSLMNSGRCCNGDVHSQTHSGCDRHCKCSMNGVDDYEGWNEQGNYPIVHISVTWYHLLTVIEAGANVNQTNKVCSVW